MSNYSRYKELIDTYKVGVRYTGEDTDQFDVIIEYAGTGYAHTKYRVLKNTPNLCTRDLALLADRGNLCFGYRMEKGLIVVHTD